jgi:hypothetical protein
MAAVAAALAVTIVGGYAAHWAWTGFEGNTLFDWLQLFLVPFAIPLAVATVRAERVGEGGHGHEAATHHHGAPHHAAPSGSRQPERAGRQ